MTDRSENGACSMLLELGKRMHLQPTVANVLHIYPTDSTFLLRILATRGAAMLICSLLMKSRQQLGHEKMNNSCTHASHAHDVTDLVKRVELTAAFWRLLNVEF